MRWKFNSITNSLGAGALNTYKYLPSSNMQQYRCFFVFIKYNSTSFVLTVIIYATTQLVIYFIKYALILSVFFFNKNTSILSELILYHQVYVSIYCLFTFKYTTIPLVFTSVKDHETCINTVSIFLHHAIYENMIICFGNCFAVSNQQL